MENCLLRVGPHSIAEESFLSLSEEKKVSGNKLTKTKIAHSPSLHCQQERGKGWEEKSCFKGLFYFLLPSSGSVNNKFTFKFEPVLPLECFFLVFISAHKPFINSFTISSAQLRAKKGEQATFMGAWCLANIKPR